MYILYMVLIHESHVFELWSEMIIVILIIFIIVKSRCHVLYTDGKSKLLFQFIILHFLDVYREINSMFITLLPLPMRYCII